MKSVILCALLLGQSWGDPPPVKGCVCDYARGGCQCSPLSHDCGCGRQPFAARPSYAQVYTQAMRQSKPLIVGVGCAAPDGEWLAWSAPSKWHQYEGPCLLVAVPKADGHLWRIVTLEPSASADAVRKALAASRARTVSFGRNEARDIGAIKIRVAEQC